MYHSPSARGTSLFALLKSNVPRASIKQLYIDYIGYDIEL